MNNHNHMCDITQSRQNTVNYSFSLLSSPQQFFFCNAKVQACRSGVGWDSEPLLYAQTGFCKVARFLDARFWVVQHQNPHSCTLSVNNKIPNVCRKFFRLLADNSSIFTILFIPEVNNDFKKSLINTLLRRQRGELSKPSSTKILETTGILVPRIYKDLSFSIHFLPT